jgi:hypothetical protein
MSAPRGLGWRPNRAGTMVDHAHRLLAVRKADLPLLPPLDRANHIPFRGHRIDQLNASSCVAFATARSTELFCNANNLGHVLPAPNPLYVNARREEWAGIDPYNIPPLEDIGCEPHLMMTSLEAEGFVQWVDYPYSDDPAVVNREPPPDIYAKAFSQRGARWAVAEEVGQARVERVREALLSRVPVMFGLTVDEPFMDNHGERIAAIDPNRIVGGHMMTVLAVFDDVMLADIASDFGLPDTVRPGDLLVDNWWGTGQQWGTPDGFGLIAGSLFGGPWVGDVTLFQGVRPVPLPRVAA